ncbi:MAG: NADH-quinone oxidoreductase subunit L [bacterium]
MSYWVWLIPILPGMAALVNGLLGPRWIRDKAGHVTAASLAASFLLSLGALASLLTRTVDSRTLEFDYFTWLAVEKLVVPAGVLIDPLAAVMMLVVTFVGTVIFVYAMGYMRGDPGYTRFFTYMPLFTFFMLLLVMGNSLPVLFIGWEGVGLCSYLLIGYYYDRDYAADAGTKAFLVNRIGDFGFLLGLLLLFWYTDTLKFTELNEKMPAVFASQGVPVTVISLLLFLGATGKSAQIPLYVWLPDAMAGPTPVSALIHAATMVTAGVYMMARLHTLFSLAPAALLVAGAVGGLTAIGAASIALTQRDAKKILAYSTISQLGYMFVACGSGAYAAAIFHLMTHAFFKACLFLGAGSVLHAFHRTTDVDVFEAGGLRKSMPYTRATFLTAALAIAGIPPLAGFFSKDEILWEAFSAGRIFLWMLGCVAAFLTAFYMFRLYNLLFSGEFRGTAEQQAHLHESPALMWVPLAVLAFFSVTAGWLNMPLFGYTGFHDFLGPVAHPAHAPERESLLDGAISEHMAEWLLAAVSMAVALAGIFCARLVYVWAPDLAGRLREFFAAPYQVLIEKYRVDEIYHEVFVQHYLRLCRAVYDFDERVIVAGLNGLARSTAQAADRLRRVQTGSIPHYALATVLGMVFLAVWLLLCY